MSGYVSGLLSLLAIQTVIAYSVYLPASAGLLNLGSAGFVLIGAYSAGAVTSLAMGPLWLGLLVGALSAGLIAFVIAFPILRTQGIYMVLATFAFAEVVSGVILNIPELGGAAGLSVMTYAGMDWVWGAALLVIAFCAWVMSTYLGLSLRAVHDDPNVADLFGVNLRKSKVIAFTLGGAIGGLGGGLLVHHFNFIDVQSTGVLFSIYVLLYVLLGGTQTVWGPIVGAIFFTLIPEVLRSAADLNPALKFLESARYMIFGVLVVAVMALRPQGLMTQHTTHALGRLARRLWPHTPAAPATQSLSADALPSAGMASTGSSPAAAGTWAIEIHHLQKAFGGLVVIDDVSFKVKMGSKTALIGPNGAGKSTLFNLLSGVYPIDAGEMRLNGQDIAQVPSRQRIGLGLSRSFQNIRLMPHLSVLENTLLGEFHWRPLWQRVKSKASQERALKALNEAGLGSFEGQVVSDLPYGTQKKIEIVRALMARPTVLLLDEPAAGLNSAESLELNRFLDSIAKKGITLMVVEHDMPFIRNLCDEVVVLNFGKKIFEGDTHVALGHQLVKDAYLGQDSAQSAGEH